MKTRHLIALSILAGWNAPTLWAQALTLPPTRPASAPDPVRKVETPAEPAAVTDAPKSPRALSNEVSAAIAVGMPKFDPAAKVPAPKPEAETADLRDTDKPKNRIIRLPQVLVREPRNPVLRERDVNTKAGMIALAEKRYITDADRALNRWNIFGVRSTNGGNSTTERALSMYAEDERLRNLAELNDDAAIVSASDKAAGMYIKREAEKTYRRSPDFGGEINREKGP